jgi:hypothetical protein
MLNGLFPGINQTPGFNQGINQAPGQMFPGLGGGGQPQPDFGLPPGMEEMPMIDPSQLRGGGQLVGGAYGKPIFGGGPAPIQEIDPGFNLPFPGGGAQPGYQGPGPAPGEDPMEYYRRNPNEIMPGNEMPMVDPSQLPGGAGWERDTQGGMGRQPIFGGGQQQPITAGTGQLPPGFGSLSPIDRSQIGRGQIGMTGAPANRFAPPNAPGVRTARQSQPPPAPARVPAARVSNTNVQTPARVAPRSAPKPITRTRSR